MNIKESINYGDFSKLDIRVGTIVAAERVAGSEKLIKLSVDFGEFTRTILTGMQKWYDPEHFVDKQTLFLVNLEYKKMMGLESQGMLLSLGIDHEQKPILIIPEEEVRKGEGLS